MPLGAAYHMDSKLGALREKELDTVHIAAVGKVRLGRCTVCISLSTVEPLLKDTSEIRTPLY